jgi:DNA mismatch endonuclease (patch repair protein)
MTSHRRPSPEMLSTDPVRSRIMGAIRQKNTRPETMVRQVLHGLGLRFRLHGKNLPGTPDIVLPKHKCVVFVHGCFWHRHGGCVKTTMPKTRVEFWREKFDRNVERDRLNAGALLKQGWKVLVIWECETRDQTYLRQRLSTSFVLPVSDAPQ